MDIKDALPLKWNESVYVVPTTDNKHVKNLLSHIPNGLSKVSELNWDSLSQQDHPLVGVFGRCVYGIGFNIHSQEDINTNCFSIGLHDIASNRQICLKVKDKPARSFPSPGVCDIFVITDNIQLNHEFRASSQQSQDISLMLQVDNHSKGCVVVVNEFLYSTQQQDHPKVDSLLHEIHSMCTNDLTIPQRVRSDDPIAQRVKQLWDKKTSAEMIRIHSSQKCVKFHDQKSSGRHNLISRKSAKPSTSIGTSSNSPSKYHGLPWVTMGQDIFATAIIHNYNMLPHNTGFIIFCGQSICWVSLHSCVNIMHYY